jgi:hypothetical protein
VNTENTGDETMRTANAKRRTAAPSLTGDPGRIARQVKGGLGRPWLISQAIDGHNEITLACAADHARAKRDEAERVDARGKYHARWAVTCNVFSSLLYNPKWRAANFPMNPPIL